MSISTDIVFFDPRLGEVYIEGNIDICMLDSNTVILFKYQEEQEVARYQQGTIHEAIALFDITSEQALRVINDNGLPFPDKAEHDQFFCHHEAEDEAVLCQGHLHVAYSYDHLPPMAVFYKRLRGARLRNSGLTFGGGNTPWDWTMITPADDAWLPLMDGFAFDAHV